MFNPEAPPHRQIGLQKRIRTLQANEVLKEITEAGDSLAGRLLIYDAKGGRFESVRVAWDPDNALSGRSPTIKDHSIHESAVPTAACADD